MALEHVARMPKQKLLRLLEDAYKNLMRVDGYYFMEIEKVAGPEAAVRCDEAVWQRFGRVEAYQLRQYFNLDGEGIPALVQALRSSLVLPLACQYQVEQLSPREAKLKVTNCQAQVNRLNAGLGIFQCQGVEEAYFGSFATTIDPRIKVKCISCPPSNYSPELWCQWQFELQEAPQ